MCIQVQEHSCKILPQADKVNLCVYNLNWFEYTVAEQRSLLMILQRNHRPIGLSAANYFSCNLVTFHWVSERTERMVKHK